MVQIPDKAFVRSKGADHYPRDWAKWCDAVRRGAEPGALGLSCAHEGINRFSARFRAAKAYGGLTLQDYTPEIEAGYSASIGLFLAYAAFDGLCRVKDCAAYEAEVWLETHAPKGVTARVRALDRQNRIMRESVDHLSGKLVPKVQAYLAGNDCSYLVPVMALRHLFVHGVLTPSVNGADPTKFAEICDLLAGTLLRGIDDEFSTLFAKSALAGA